MLFHSSIRRELGKNFSVTLVALVTIIMTTTTVRTLNEASGGAFNPSDVLIIMGYTVISDMPTILTICLFISVLSTLNRMYRDSEMVIWFSSGRGIASLIKPLLQFAWPILVAIFSLAFLLLPWAYGRIEDFRFQYERRSDIARIEPGQFQESAQGDRVFFIEKDNASSEVGHNVFIATRENGKEAVTSAKKGRIEVTANGKVLVLEKGQRLERDLNSTDLTISHFDSYTATIAGPKTVARDYEPYNAMSTLALVQNGKPEHFGELAWRAGLPIAAFNFLVIGIAVAGVNPRVGRHGNIAFAFLTFVAYFNLLVLSKNWVSQGKIQLWELLFVLHGGALLLAALWLTKRHFNWQPDNPLSTIKPRIKGSQ